MANPIHRSVFLDHKLMIDGVTFHEHKVLQNEYDENNVKQGMLSHTRAIGDQSYTAIQKIVDGNVQDEVIETTMTPEEIENFRNEWEEKWHPSISERSTGIMSTFFKKLDNFLN